MDTEQLKSDAAAASTSKLSLEEIIRLGEQLETLSVEVSRIEEELSVKKEELRVLSEATLPEALMSLGMTEFKLKSGYGICIEDVVSASIKDDNREAAHSWMRNNGYADLIKNEVAFVFGQGEDSEADRLKKFAETINYGMQKNTERIHPQTLNAQVREWLSNGVVFPHDIFKLFLGQRARLVKPKKSAA